MTFSVTSLPKTRDHKDNELLITDERTFDKELSVRQDIVQTNSPLSRKQLSDGAMTAWYGPNDKSRAGIFCFSDIRRCNSVTK